MVMHTSVVVVDQRPPVVAAVVGALTEAGYSSCGAHAFGDAVWLLATKPDVVDVSVELGTFNGLHLLLRSSVDSPATRVIVVGPQSRGMEAEARALGAAAYLARPVTAAAIVEQVALVSCQIPLPPSVHDLAGSDVARA